MGLSIVKKKPHTEAQRHQGRMKKNFHAEIAGYAEEDRRRSLAEPRRRRELGVVYEYRPAIRIINSNSFGYAQPSSFAAASAFTVPQRLCERLFFPKTVQMDCFYFSKFSPKRQFLYALKNSRICSRMGFFSQQPEHAGRSIEYVAWMYPVSVC